MPDHSRRVHKSGLKKRVPDRVPSGAGTAEGAASMPTQQKPEDAEAPEEVTTIPIGVPESEESFRDRKKRARRRSSIDEPAQVDPEEEQ